MSGHFYVERASNGCVLKMIVNAFVEKLAAGYQIQQSVKKPTSTSPFVMYMGGKGGRGKQEL